MFLLSCGLSQCWVSAILGVGGRMTPCIVHRTVMLHESNDQMLMFCFTSDHTTTLYSVLIPVPKYQDVTSTYIPRVRGREHLQTLPPPTSNLTTAAVSHVLIRHPPVPCDLLYTLCFCPTRRFFLYSKWQLISTNSLSNNGISLNEHAFQLYEDIFPLHKPTISRFNLTTHGN